jgi:hypothetical protein
MVVFAVSWIVTLFTPARMTFLAAQKTEHRAISEAAILC